MSQHGVDKERGLRLLSLDGGGVRGLSELLILREIMKQVQLLSNLEQIPLPADYFDMIGGTSTGGLIAILLGRLRMPIDEAIDLFDTLSSTIFGKKQSRIREGRYPHQVLEDCVKDVVAKQHDGNRDAKFRQTEEEGCKSFVCTVSNKGVPHTRLFRSYASPTIDDYDCAIWEAARATSAAPKYFRAVRIGLPGREETFFDGGIGCNNPIKELHSEARSVFSESRLVDCILSIGTGLRNAIQVDEPGFFGKISIGVDMTLISAFKKMALSSSEAAREMERKYSGMGDLYVRLDVNEGLQRVKLDEWGKLGEIRGRTLEYLSLPTTQTKVHAVAQVLAGSKRSDTTDSYSLGQLSSSINEVIHATQERSLTNAENTTVDSRDVLQEWLRSSGSSVTSSADDLKFHLSKRYISEDNEYISCNWVFGTPQYQSFWSHGPASSLWIHGPPGCGKSVITAAIIDQLLQITSKKQKPVVLYYFCDTGMGMVTPMTMLRSFLAQILSTGTQSDLRKAIYELDQCRQKISVLRDADIMAESALWEVLKDILSLYSYFPYIVIDGIEAVEFNTALMKFLIHVAPRANVVLTSRFRLKSMENVVRSSFEKANQLEITTEHTSEDLTRYVTEQVNGKLSSLAHHTQELRSSIALQIFKRSEGMFLYATLALGALQGDAVSTKAAVVKVLNGLPNGLESHFDKYLEAPANSTYGAQIFRWLYTALQPLTWNELRSTLSISAGGVSYDHLPLEDSHSFIKKSCGQLVEVSGNKDGKIRFIHSSIKTFLSNYNGSRLLDTVTAHAQTTSDLLKFLQYDNLPDFAPPVQQGWKAIVDQFCDEPGHAIYVYAVKNWYKHLRHAENDASTTLKEQVGHFLTTKAFSTWLKAIMYLGSEAGSGIDSASLVVDLVDALRTWATGDVRSEDSECQKIVKDWIPTFVRFMRDWGKTLEDQPFWIHFIYPSFLGEGSLFKKALKLTNTQTVMQMQPELKLQQELYEGLPLHAECFATDIDRGFAYTFDGEYLSCYQLSSGLRVSDYRLSVPRLEDDNISYSLSLKRGLICPGQRYIALTLEIVFESKDPMVKNIRNGLKLNIGTTEGKDLAWTLESATDVDITAAMALLFGVKGYPFATFLLQLHHTDPTRISLLGLPPWANSPLVCETDHQIRWELDDMDVLAFSPDSSLLYTPIGILNTETGSIIRSSDMYKEFDLYGCKVAEDFKRLIVNRSLRSIELRELDSGAIRHEFRFESNVHLLAVSNHTRYLLILKVSKLPDEDISQTNNKKASYIRGTVGVFDCTTQTWTALLILDPPFSARQSPWQLLSHRTYPIFSHEPLLALKPIRIRVVASRGWKVAENVLSSGLPDFSKPSSRTHAYIFESEPYTDGFGAFPSLKQAIPVITSIARSTRTLEDMKSRVISWSSDLKSAQVYANYCLKTISIDDYGGPIVLTRSLESKKTDLQRGFIQPPRKQTTGQSALLLTYEKSMMFFLQLYLEFREANAESQKNWLSKLTSYGVTPLQVTSKLNIYRLSIGQATLESFAAKGLLPHKEILQLLQTKQLYIADYNQIGLTSIEVDISSMKIRQKEEEKESIEFETSIYEGALESFKRISQPLHVSSTKEFARSFVWNPEAHRYTIYGGGRIKFAAPSNPVEDGNTSLQEYGPVFQANGAFTGQKNLYLFQFSRPMPSKESMVERSLQSRQYEVYLSIYDKALRRITWFLHTLTAGEMEPAKSSIPEIAWALHPHQPLLAYLIPGHCLRVSNIKSHQAPVKIGDPLSPSLTTDQALTFSPNGYYLLFKGHTTFKNDMISDAASYSGRRLVHYKVFNLTNGLCTSLTLSTNTSLSATIHDESFLVYRLTRSGAVEMLSYSLPHLIACKVSIVTFIPARCHCSGCGHVYEESCTIFVDERHGRRLVVISHDPIHLGRGSMSSNPCPPLILQDTSRAIVRGATAEPPLTGKMTFLAFPPLLDSKGNLLADAFNCPQRLEEPVQQEEPNVIRTPEGFLLDVPTKIPQMIFVFENFKCREGDEVRKDQLESYINKVEEELVSQSTFGKMGAQSFSSTFDSLKSSALADYIPFDSYSECQEAINELKEADPSFGSFYGKNFGDGCGVGTQIPVFVHTFYFSPGDSEGTGREGISWSAAMEMGWIEESVELFIKNFFNDDFSRTRLWYPFSAYRTLPVRVAEIENDASYRGDRFRKYFGGHFNTATSLEGGGKVERLLPSIPKSKQDVSGTGVLSGKENTRHKNSTDVADVVEPMLFLNDYCDALSDLVPGLGEFWRLRLHNMLNASFGDKTEL